MANKITYTQINPQTYVSTLSRYRDQQSIQYGDNNLLAFATYKRPDYAISNTDTVFMINGATAYRPDKVSLMKYGFVDYWYKIMELNKIYDIMDFKAGRTIYLPTVTL
jgi:hypothetical protein